MSERRAESAALWASVFWPDEEPVIPDWKWAGMQVLSEKWDTCACGSLDDGIPRNRDASFGGHDSNWGWMPLDGKLGDLGVDFHAAIVTRNWAKAKKLFLAIQRRGAEILESIKTGVTFV